MPDQLTTARAARHAALHGKLTTLLTQVAAVARTRPGEAVAPVVLALAGDLLFEAREFRPRGERRGLPGVAPDHAGLAAQLGQALAMLDAWQRNNQPPADPDGGHSDEEVEEMRHKLAKRLDELVQKAVRMRDHAENLPSNQRDSETYPRIGAPH